jgi:hypothetical protein
MHTYAKCFGFRSIDMYGTVLWKAENQRAVVRDLLYILTPTQLNIDWLKRATNFPYFLHNEFGGFTARKLLD